MKKNDFQNSSFFAIEGPAFAGKTTIINYLEKNYGNEVSILPEASEYVGGDNNFPNIPFASIEDAKSSTHFFLEMEKMRCREALEVSKQSNKKILFDRTTMLSSIIFYDLLETNFKEMHKFKDSFKQYALEICAKTLKEKEFFVPDKIILVKPKNKEVFESRLSRGTKNSMFGHWSSVEFLLKEYFKVINSNYKNNFLVIDTDNTIENLEEDAKKILDFIKNKSKYNEKIENIFSLYQGEEVEKIYNPDTKEEKKKFENSINIVQELVKRAKCQEV